jgi:hypothetical protein
MSNDPTKDPEFQKVVQHFVTHAPKTHDEMRADKHKSDGDTKASPKKRGRPAKVKPSSEHS